jgi:uncharacterized membrane-anchored protein
MRFRFAIACVILQVLVLAYMAGEREWILRHGRSVLLRTAPIDPNDPMRGDYVRLDYDISQVPRKFFEGGLPTIFVPTTDYRRERDRRVFARLQVGEDGVANLAALTDVQPVGELFIRGRTQNLHERYVQVRYGIEALFMQQGTARKLEDMRARERPGVPLDIEVALSSSGIAVIKNYHWEPLGLTITFVRESAPERVAAGPAADSAQRRRFITGLNIELKNYGPGDVAIVDLPDAGSFRLVPNERWQDTRYRWVGENRTPPPPQASHVMVLKAGQSHHTKIDLTQAAWFVVDATNQTSEGKLPRPLRDVTDPWSASFRLEYAPPDKASVPRLPHAELIRHGRLRSRAFNPTEGLD